MDCSYCKKPVKISFDITEDVPGEGPSKRRACFPCIVSMGEKIMNEHRQEHLCDGSNCTHESHR